ncbi:uncharacterized protein JCM6883_005494 [Sporobolomyces salmoneus]|uniref:uncharacterized protein n=1 Tax=Sporobolomyces salmoneus TaxID=183962 RepID=UPI003170C19D
MSSTKPSSTTRPRSRNKPSNPSKATRTSSSPKKRNKEHWSTDEDEDDSNTETRRRTRQAKLKQRRPAPSILRNLVFSFLRSFLYPLIPYILLAGSLYFTIAYCRYLLYSYLSLLPSFLQPSLSRIANISLPLPQLSTSSFSTLTCATLGLNCPRNLNLVSGAARRAAYKGEQALTIFDHLLALGDQDSSTGLALHPVEIWELSTAIRYSSQIEDREFVSTELAALGDSVREVKDSVIDLNAQGMNAFIWIVHEFTRLEEAITRAAESEAKGKRTSKQQEADLNRLLDSLFDKINLSLGDLLTSLDKAIPIATSASDKSRRIFGTLRAEESQTERQLQEKSWIEWMKEVKGKKGKQLRRDLELTRGSAEAVIGVMEALEGTRNSLKGYRNNVGYFKAGVVGYHLSSNDLSVEDEVNSLKSVMNEMKQTLSEARGRTRRPSVDTVREIGST